MEEGILDIELVYRPILVMARVSTARTMASFMMGLKVLS
jgi:hypothetical protein